jgi:hypothetical protein
MISSFMSSKVPARNAFAAKGTSPRTSHDSRRLMNGVDKADEADEGRSDWKRGTREG